MRISRLRLRLTFWFGAAFLIGLLVLDAGFLIYSRRKGALKLERDTELLVRNLVHSIIVEINEQNPDSGFVLEAGVVEALGEWPAGPERIAIYDSTDRLLGQRGERAAELLEPLRHSLRGGTMRLDPGDGDAFQVAWQRESGSTPVLVVVANSATRLQEDQEALVGWLLISLPLIGLGSAFAGYAMARRALTPVLGMARALDDIDPDRIDRRLPVGAPGDELNQQATHFNGLLDRLAGARESARRFLAQAAHQLRTPLTVVRGESALGLDRPRSPNDYQAALRRINLAAEQMSRRVGELFLLAEAEAGERPSLTDRVELDGLVMEAADLMRSRASSLGRTLQFGRMDDVTVTGAEALLREVVMELIENACRHGTAEHPVELAVRRNGSHASIEVSSAGPPFSEGPTQGLGLSIVRWVAEQHEGRIQLERRDGLNVVALTLAIR